MESKIIAPLIHIFLFPTSVYTFVSMLRIKLLGITTTLPFNKWMVWVLFILTGLYTLGNVALLFLRVWNRYMGAKERLLDYEAKDAALKRLENKN